MLYHSRLLLDTCIYVESLKALFDVRFSEKGCIYRLPEEQTYIFFVDFLDECKGQSLRVATRDSTAIVFWLYFAVIDEDISCTLYCSLLLRLPAIYKQYADFWDAMILGIQGNDGFGGVWLIIILSLTFLKSYFILSLTIFMITFWFCCQKIFKLW